MNVGFLCSQTLISIAVEREVQNIYFDLAV